MRIILAAACLALTACGTTFDQRLQLYQTGAAIAGRPDIAAGIGILRPVLTSAKQPRNVQP